MRIRTTMFLAVCALAACARAFPPSGGEPDRQPPRIISTTPAALAVVRPSDDKVVFRFDETLSERGFTEALVTVSPLDSALRVKRSGNEISVGIDGGWRADRVYRIVLLPGIRDLFGNDRKDAIELVFSTGPPVQETAIAGIVTDRITGRAAQNAVVTATRRADSALYMAVGDTGGFYSLRNVPLGTYDMRAYIDANRNRRRDRSESSDSGKAVTLGAASDTIAQLFAILPIDTTGPRLTKAVLMDSLHVRVTIDDWMDVTASLVPVGVVVYSLPDSVRIAAGSAATASEYERLRAALVAAADTSAAARRPSTGRPGGRSQGPAAGATHDIVVTLERVLRPGSYTITLSDLSNIQGFVGGGTVKFEVRETPPPRTGIRPDTVNARRQRP